MSFFFQSYMELLRNLVGRSAKPRNGIFDAISEVIEKGKYVLLSAPPGYGKTMIPYTFAYFATKFDEIPFMRVIHVLPLRSIIEDVYGRIRDANINELSDPVIGRQMMHVHEAPYLQKIYVITTIDTFIMSLAKLPPREIQKVALGKSYGYGEFVRASIFSSVIVFDEIQLFLEEGEKLPAVFLASIIYLAKMRIPMVLMSATFPYKMIVHVRREIENRIGNKTKVVIFRYGETFKDDAFENEHLSKRMTTKIEEVTNENEINVLIDRVLQFVETYDRVLVVLNNVHRAKALAENLIREQNLKAILLHGRLRGIDREIRLKKIRESKWVAIATQVVEAGVDISCQAMITDVAGITALIQRAGRFLRRKKDEEGELVIIVNKDKINDELAYGIYPHDLVKKTVEVLKKKINEQGFYINWHLPRILKEKAIGYEDIIDEIYSQISLPIEQASGWISCMLNVLECKDTRDVYDILWGIFKGSFTRDYPLSIAIVVDDYDEFRNEVPYDYLIKYVEKNSFPISLHDLKRFYKRNLLGVFYNVYDPEQSKFKVQPLKEALGDINKGRHLERKMLRILKPGKKTLFGVLIPFSIYKKEYDVEVLSE